jgi:hypothetical protein
LGQGDISGGKRALSLEKKKSVFGIIPIYGHITSVTESFGKNSSTSSSLFAWLGNSSLLEVSKLNLEFVASYESRNCKVHTLVVYKQKPKVGARHKARQ